MHLLNRLPLTTDNSRIKAEKQILINGDGKEYLNARFELNKVVLIIKHGIVLVRTGKNSKSIEFDVQDITGLSKAIIEVFEYISTIETRKTKTFTELFRAVCRYDVQLCEDFKNWKFFGRNEL